MLCCLSRNSQVRDEEDIQSENISNNIKKIKNELFKTRKNNYIGFGVSSNVFKVQVTKNKHITCKVIKEGWEESAEREIKLLKIISNLNNEKFPKFFCSFKQNLNDVICYDYIQGVDLFSYISETSKISIFYNNENLIIETMLQILYGLESLLTLNLVHLDVKPENIIIQSTNPVKINIIDLNFCRNYKDKIIDKVLGTFGYISPEMLFYKKIYYNTDIWSIGVIIFLLYTNAFIFNIEEDKYATNISTSNKVLLILNKYLNKVPKNIGIIVERCLVYNTNNRISVVGLISLIKNIYH